MRWAGRSARPDHGPECAADRAAGAADHRHTNRDGTAGADLSVNGGQRRRIFAEGGYARGRPVETVLSGPAASLSGAAFLAGQRQTRWSRISAAQQQISRGFAAGRYRPQRTGPWWGGWRTCVEAAHIRTSGLGGDSEVAVRTRDMVAGVNLGPRRAIR